MAGTLFIQRHAACLELAVADAQGRVGSKPNLGPQAPGHVAVSICAAESFAYYNLHERENSTASGVPLHRLCFHRTVRRQLMKGHSMHRESANEAMGLDVAARHVSDTFKAADVEVP